MSRADELRRLAADTFGWSRLRDEQLTAMEHVLAGHDVLVVLPTGAGKSAIYQVPALRLPGPTVVVSPLLALQRDQIDGIEASAAPDAVAVNSAQRDGEREHAWEAVRAGTAEYLFLSPEQLVKPDVLAAVAELDVSLFVVDEAHCVSAWGHDFRPDYLRLADAIDRLGHPTVVALTATAAPPVREDIVRRLGLRDHREVIAGFDRPRLHLAVHRFGDDGDKRAAVLERATGLGTASGLLYTATRKDAEYYADGLRAAGIRAAAYHAGMKAAERAETHERFLADEVDVVAATSAFGMGIDKPDVRFVLHASVPDSLDSYYQQVGRAGRDDEPADIELYYRPEDLARQRFLTAHKAPEDALSAVADLLHERRKPVRPSKIDLPAARRTRALNLLEQAGAVMTAGNGRVEWVGGTPEEAVRAAVELAETHQRLLRSRLEMMRGYAETTGCRRQYLLGYFGEQLTRPCGNCDTCEAGSAHRQPRGTGEFAVHSPVRHVEWGHGVVMSVGADRLTILFDDEGYKTLSLTDVRGRDLLRPG